MGWKAPVGGPSSARGSTGQGFTTYTHYGTGWIRSSSDPEFERLGASQGPGQDGESYVHDGLDRRDLKLTRDGGARVSEYSYVGTSESLAREQRPDGGAADYDYSASGERMGQRMRDSDSDEFHPYAKDANGSVEALEQDDGSIAEADRYRYDPYGELEDPNEDNDQDADEELGTDAESNPFRFQGFYYDAAIKTYDMQAREYRPDVGRFLSADRFEAAGMDLALQSDPLTQNRYAFAGGNPVSRIEFDGHCAYSRSYRKTYGYACNGTPAGGYKPAPSSNPKAIGARGGRAPRASVDDYAKGDAQIYGRPQPRSLERQVPREVRVVAHQTAYRLAIAQCEATECSSEEQDTQADRMYEGFLHHVDIATTSGVSAPDAWASGLAGQEETIALLTGEKEAPGLGNALLNVTPLGRLKGISRLPKVLSTAVRGSDEFVDLTSTARRRHVLYGDRSGGGHLWPGMPGKTSFPKRWSADRVIHEISDVATDPRASRVSGPGGQVYVRGTRDGVDIEVLLRNNEIVTGYPTNLPRNPP